MQETENVPMQDQVLAQAEAKTKELLSQIKAALQLWQVQNKGKAPEVSDIMGMLTPKEQEIDPSEPRILSFKVLYGNNPQSPVYYHDPVTNGYFDIHGKDWLNERPALCDHLNEREIGTTDVFDAILHGVMDDEDYGALEKMELIDDRSRQLWKKLSALSEQTNMMMKSVETEGNGEPEVKKPNTPASEEESSSGSNPFLQIKAGAGVQSDSSSAGEGSAAGENVFDQIMAGAKQPTAAVEHEPVDYEAVRHLVQQAVATALNEDPWDLFGEDISPVDISNHFKNLEMPQFNLDAEPQENTVPDEVHQQAFQRG